VTNRDHLIVFTRFPNPGKTKTRLIPALGAEGAADLQRRMTEHTVAQARKTGAQIEIRWTDGSEEQVCEWLGDDLQYAGQGAGDLGDRMARAFEEHFKAGAGRVVIVGCDCPSNDWKNIRKSFQCLETSNFVIGPAVDGGYYLIGLTRPMPELFHPPSPEGSGATGGVEWGSKKVLKQTLSTAPEKPAFLETLDDVDLPGDIPPKISVIIPTLNEAETIFPRHSLARASGWQTLEKVGGGFDVESIVVDGGSADGTSELVPNCLLCTGGRAAQQNRGAAAAIGEILLFLHADTELPDNWDFIIRDELKKPWVSLGAFRFQVKERLLGIGAVEWGANIRSRIFQMPYGDQGLFLRHDTFEAIGGFPDQPILEDVELVRRARRLGKIVTLREAALTSGRRWQKRGVFQTTLINQLVLIGAAFGVSPQKLRRLYG